MTALLEARGIAAWYGASHILRGIDLDVAEGETLALMGRNGMGKTTLLRTLMGLTAQRAGTVRFAGVDVSRAAPDAIARAGVALVPEGRGVFGALSVRENLVMAARPGVDGRDDWTFARVMETFPRLSERLTHGGAQLSGGEQQMLTIGRALMTNPRLLMLDEATEGLAPMIAAEIWATIAGIAATGVATVVVDKNVRALSKLADRAVLIVKGEVVFDGPFPNLLAAPDVLHRHLGV